MRACVVSSIDVDSVSTVELSYVSIALRRGLAKLDRVCHATRDTSLAQIRLSRDLVGHACEDVLL